MTEQHPQTKREKEYSDAVAALYNYRKKPQALGWILSAMGRPHHDYPDDHEATPFYAFALINADDDNDATMPSGGRLRRCWNRCLPRNRIILESRTI